MIKIYSALKNRDEKLTFEMKIFKKSQLSQLCSPYVLLGLQKYLCNCGGLDIIAATIKHYSYQNHYQKQMRQIDAVKKPFIQNNALQKKSRAKN